MDEFLYDFNLSALHRRADKIEKNHTEYVETNDENIRTINEKLTVLTDEDTAINEVLTEMAKSITYLTDTLGTTQQELERTQLVNLKQEIVIRTMHNMNVFNAYDMLADTFTSVDGLDWANSIRAELITARQSIGRNIHATKDIGQSLTSAWSLISNNGASDLSIAQSFKVAKRKQLEKIRVYVEKYDAATWQPLRVRITSQLGGEPLSEVNIQAANIQSGWLDADLPNIMLEANTLYYLEVYTKDTYGYKIGYEPTRDTYSDGSSYSLLSSQWTHNNNDIAFEIWCYPAEDENNATIFTMPKQLETMPKAIVFEKEDTITNGYVEYHASRDGGATWVQLQSGQSTSFSTVGEGTTLILKAFIQGEAEINAWGYVLTGRDK